MSSDREEQEDELLALHSIFGCEEFVRNDSNSGGECRVTVQLPEGFTMSLTEGESVRQYELSFLPNLLLTFNLPADYPSSSPPSFTLICPWLTHSQLSALRCHLSDLYRSARGAVVLFSWVQFLREEAISFLDIHSVLELPGDDHSQHTTQSHEKNNQVPSQSGCTDDPNRDDTNDSDPSIQGAAALLVQSPETSGLSLTTSQTLLSQLLIYDAVQKQKAFSTTVFDCAVCFMGSLGSRCVQLLECGHVFCQTCMAEFCRIQITEGNVRGVTCPEASCSASPTPAQVRDLVDEELFSRYDRLLLQSTLDLMSDVMYCPRRSCGSPVIVDKSSTAALCCVCSLAFCVTCKKTYHGAVCQPVKYKKKLILTELQEANADLPQSQEGMKALMDDYLSGSKQRQGLLLSRYGRQAMHAILPDFLSEDWVVFNSKSCPHCFCKIQKNGGCNMMTCSQCRQRFCWLCLTRFTHSGTGSRHFAESSCSQYG